MALDDHPQIDAAAINCRDSELALENIFKERNGFTSRKQSPDKGCDYQIEISQSGNSKNWDFQVQLKSVEKLPLIEKGKIISYPFETSRLGYLLRKKPTTGIIVLYSVEDNKAYYDFIASIYYKILDNQKNEDWKQQEKVQIHVPITNLLTIDSAKQIYQQVTEWSVNFDKLLLSQGSAYNLPVIAVEPDTGFDVNNIEHIKSKLKEFGLALLQSSDLAIVLQMLHPIPFSDLVADSLLTQIAAAAYCESGNHIDSLYFANKCLQDDQLSGDKLQGIKWIKLRNEFNLAYTNKDDFMQQAEELRNAITSDGNKLIIESNLIYFSVTTDFGQASGNAMLDLINRNFNTIEKLNINSDIKANQLMLNTDSLAACISSLKEYSISEFKLSESIGKKFTSAQKIAQVKHLQSLEENLFVRIGKLNDLAIEIDNRYIQTSCISIRNKFLLSGEMRLLTEDVHPLKNDHDREKFIRNTINLSLHAYNMFIELNYIHRAYESLCNALEFLYIARHVMNISFDETFDDKKFISIKEDIERRLKIPEYLLQSENILNNKHDEKKPLTDEDIDTLAQKVKNLYKLPESHVANIISELKALRLFESRCKNADFILERAFPYGLDWQKMYCEPVKWTLRNKKSNIVSAEDTDIENLLSNWGFS